MPDRDPTPGELRIMFGNILDSLKDVKESMATKEFVNTKFDGYNERVGRLEEDVKDWIRSSSEAHVKLDADGKARHELAETDFKAGNQQINQRIDGIEADQKAQEAALKAQRNGRVQAIGISVLGVALSIIGSVVSASILRGLF